MTVKVTKPALNLREELSSLKKPSGVAGEAMLRAETPQEQFNLIGAGRKNMVINGNFMVSQRASYSSATAITSTAYRFDRWEANLTQAATIKDLDYGCRLESTASSSSGNLSLRQPIELNGSGEDVLDKTITISALVRSNNPNASVMYYSTSWGTARATHSGNGEWERLSITFQLTSVNTGGGYSFMPQVGIDGVNSAGVAIAVGDYVEVKEVQAELGSVATPFEHRSYGEELALCQRYYQEGTMLTSSDLSTDYPCYTVRPDLRAVPSITYIFNGGSGGSYALWNSGHSMVLYQNVAHSAKGYGGTFFLDAEL